MSDDGYEYTVRYQELDAHGKPCGWCYWEWSGGFERVTDLREAQATAHDWREDKDDGMGVIEVVRRPRREWQIVPMQTNQLGVEQRGNLWVDCNGLIWAWDDSISEWNTIDGSRRFGGYLEKRYAPYTLRST